MRFLRVFRSFGQETEEVQSFIEEFWSMLLEAKNRHEVRYKTEVPQISVAGEVDLWDGARPGGTILDSDENLLSSLLHNGDYEFTISIDLGEKDQFVIELHHHDGVHEMRMEWMTPKKLERLAPNYLVEGIPTADEMEGLAIETRPFIRFEKWMSDYISPYWSEDFSSAKAEWRKIKQEKEEEKVKERREALQKSLDEAKERESEIEEFHKNINKTYRHIPIYKVKSYSTFENFGKSAEKKGPISFRETTGFLTKCYTKDNHPYEFLITRYKDKDKQLFMWKAEDPIVYSLIKKVTYFSFAEAFIETKRIISNIEYDKLLKARERTQSYVNYRMDEKVEFPKIEIIEELDDKERSVFIKNDECFANLIEGKKNE